jgi:hypothetical protein
VNVKVTANILKRNEPWQSAGKGRLNLAAVLAELGLDIRQPDR